MVTPKHILGTFDEALSALRNNVLMMAGLTERSLDRAMKGLFNRDDNLCITAIADDEEIDQLEKQIDKDGVEILFGFNQWRRTCGVSFPPLNFLPTSSDSAIRQQTSRIRARKLNQHPPLSEVDLITPMREKAMAMFKDSVNAYVRENVELARSIGPCDQALDEMNRDVNGKLIQRMAQDRDQLRGYFNLMFIARALERVGDHATNIAEDAVYAAAAEDIRHPSLTASV